MKKQNNQSICVITLGCSKNLVDSEILIGSTEKVLIDLYTDDGFSIGRSYRDSPEVDNTVRIKDKLPIGKFIDIRIIEATEYELLGSSISS